MPWAESWFLPSRARELLERRFSNNIRLIAGASWPRGMAPDLAALLKVLDNVDQRVLNDTFSPEQGMAWIQNLEHMRTAVRQWEGGGHEGFILKPLVDLYVLLKECPDEPAPLALPRLTIIRDKKLRESIARDVDSLGALVRAEQWKAATVLGGSVIEALLLDRLEGRKHRSKVAAFAASRVAAGDKRWKAAPDRWDLWQLVEAAQHVGLIDAAVAGVCNGARDFRNLIHAGKERARVAADRGTSHVVYGAVHRLMTLFGGKQ